jgi:hypothetical protein
MDIAMKSLNAPHPKTESEAVDTGRRQVVALAIMALPVLLLGAAGASADAAACFDLESLPSSQKRQRRSLGFKLAAADDQKHCGSCAFFIASGGGCGTCEMLGGGATSTVYVCDSWAAKN